MKVAELYPRVFLENKRQTVFARLHVDAEIEIKFQPMEAYSIPHGNPPALDEEARYPYLPMQRLGEGLYSVEYDFPVGGRYTVHIRNQSEKIYSFECPTKHSRNPEFRAIYYSTLIFSKPLAFTRFQVSL